MAETSLRCAPFVRSSRAAASEPTNCAASNLTRPHELVACPQAGPRAPPGHGDRVSAPACPALPQKRATRRSRALAPGHTLPARLALPTGTVATCTGVHPNVRPL